MMIPAGNSGCGDERYNRNPSGSRWRGNFQIKNCGELRSLQPFRATTIQIRLGHESLDVTLDYLKGKDAESEEAQEHANSSSLALYA